MKKLVLTISIICSLNAYSQNSIPTTTVTGALKIDDSLRVNKSITAKGEIIVKDTLRAKKDIIVDGNVNIGGKLKVDGKSTFKNDIIIKKSILFDAGNEFTYIPATATSKATFYLGNTGAKTSASIWNQCPNPNAISAGFTQFAFPGALVLRTPAGGIGGTNAALTMFSAPWDGNAFIEVEGTDNSGTNNNGLYINHFCTRSTHINTNWDLANNVDGGTVYLGAKVDMQQSMRIGAAGSPIDLNTSIEIDKALNNANVIKVNTSNPTVKVLSVLRNDNKNTFVVYGDGKTQIGINKPKVGGSAANAMLSVDGLILAKEIKVAIANTHWADYVFEKDYKLMSLHDVENYIIVNKHLPEVPSTKDVEKNGVDVVETNAVLLKKIEELTLYLIEQNKRIEKLEKEKL